MLQDFSYLVCLLIGTREREVQIHRNIFSDVTFSLQPTEEKPEFMFWVYL